MTKTKTVLICVLIMTLFLGAICFLTLNKAENTSFNKDKIENIQLINGEYSLDNEIELDKKVDEFYSLDNGFEIENNKSLSLSKTEKININNHNICSASILFSTTNYLPLIL